MEPSDLVDDLGELLKAIVGDWWNKPPKAALQLAAAALILVTEDPDASRD